MTVHNLVFGMSGKKFKKEPDVTEKIKKVQRRGPVVSGSKFIELLFSKIVKLAVNHDVEDYFFSVYCRQIAHHYGGDAAVRDDFIQHLKNSDWFFCWEIAHGSFPQDLSNKFIFCFSYTLRTSGVFPLERCRSESPRHGSR